MRKLKVLVEFPQNNYKTWPAMDITTTLEIDDEIKFIVNSSLIVDVMDSEFDKLFNYSMNAIKRELIKSYEERKK